MSVRTVRLDDDAESTLAALRQRTGLSVSEVLKRGLQAYAVAVRATAPRLPTRSIGAWIWRVAVMPLHRRHKPRPRSPK